MLGKVLFDLLDHLQGPLLGRSRRQLYLADDEPLVLVRQEGSRAAQEEDDHDCNDGSVNEQVADRLAERAADNSFILNSAAVERGVEPAEEALEPAVLSRVVSLWHRLEQG